MHIDLSETYKEMEKNTLPKPNPTRPKPNTKKTRLKTEINYILHYNGESITIAESNYRKSKC